MSPTSANTPVTKSRLTKNRRKSGLKPAPVSTGLMAGSSKASIPVRSIAPKASPMCAPLAIPTKVDKEITSSPSYYRNYDMYTSSPFHIPNSQAPIPGKEVYWDYDTPESRKCREAFIKEFEESDSPIAKNNDATPKLRMVAKTRIESVTSMEETKKGEQALQELLDLCTEAQVKDTSLDNGDKDSDEGKVCQLKFENLSMEMELKEEVKNDTEEDMFADEIDLGDSFNLSTGEVVKQNLENEIKIDDTKLLDDAINSDDMMFDDDDESFLLQATQAADLVLVEKKESVAASSKTDRTVPPKALKREVAVTQPLKREPSMPKMKLGPVVSHPAIARVQAEPDGFDSGDDSFDDFLSQMEVPAEVDDAPASPILKRKRKCLELTAPSTPTLPLPDQSRQQPGTAAQNRQQLPNTGGQTKQLQTGVAQNTQLHERVVQNRQLPVKTAVQNRQPSVTTAAQNKPEGGTLRKYGSFDNQKQKKAFPRVMSDPNIGSGTVSRVNNYSTSKVLSMARPSSTVLQPVSLTTNRPVTRSTCTKEDIDKKKREALARRQLSQSQARK